MRDYLRENWHTWLILILVLAAIIALCAVAAALDQSGHQVPVYVPIIIPI